MPSLRGRRSLRLGERLAGLARIGFVLLVTPIQVVGVLFRPDRWGRQARGANSRLRTGTRRLKASARDPETPVGRVWDTMRTSAFFVGEELTDIRDGFPKPSDLWDSGTDLLSRGVWRVCVAVGLANASDSQEAVTERIWRGVATGLIGACAVIGLFVSTYMGLEAAKQSEHLTILEIDVRGLDRVPAADVLARLPAGVGDNLLNLDLKGLTGPVQDLPWVQSASIRVDPTSRRIEVSVVEHRPALLLRDDGLHLIDDQGVVFKRREPGEPADLPILSIDGEGDRQTVARSALDLVRAIGAGQAVRRSDVSELRWGGPAAGFTVVTRDGLPVRVGRRDFGARLGRLERAVAAGALPLAALASVDVALRDRLVAVPLARKEARREVARRVESQPLRPAQRKQVLEQVKTRRSHLDRIRASAGTATDLPWSTP